MPVFEAETALACPPERVFDFLARPANLALVSPPELHLRLLDGPERLTLGARVTVQGSKFGFAQKIVSEVTEFDEGRSFTDEQVKGPFGRFVHLHRVRLTERGTRMLDRFTFEGPGGLFGLVLTDSRIRKGLEAMVEYRAKRFKELLET